MKKNFFKIFSLALSLLVISLTLVSMQYSQELRKQAVSLVDDASLTLTASENKIKPGETTTIFLHLSNPSQNSIDGIDVILRFDQNILQLRKITPNLETNFKTFLPLVSGGTSFDVDGVISKSNLSGRIEFGAANFNFATKDLINPVEEGNILVAQLEFEGVNEGSSLLDFDFDPDREGTTEETEDCNVVTHTEELANDILGSTDTETLIVSLVEPSPSPSPSPSSLPTPTPPIPVPSPLPTVIPRPSPSPTPIPGVDKVIIRHASLRRGFGSRSFTANQLVVIATSDQAPRAVLRADGFGRMNYLKRQNIYYLRRWTFSRPREITVTSSAGGSDTAIVTWEGF